MIEFASSPPQVAVADAEYMRLLGYPRDWVPEERARELAASARAWYAQHGRPWVYARQAKSLEIRDGVIRIDGATFESERLQSMLVEANATSVLLVAVSAGAELELEAQQRWLEEKPDEYFFLEVYGSAVVEHLITMKGAELCEWADARGEAILPHYSPGYPEWDISQQPALLELIRRDGQNLPGELQMLGDLQVLESGMLRPKKSLLAMFGLTANRDRVTRLTELNPCESCSFLSCQYRRAPYQGATRCFNRDEVAQTQQLLSQLLPQLLVLEKNARYSVNAKALARWAADRLTLTRNENGTMDAQFRYEGTTCSNMGRPLVFDYQVTLGPPEDGYVISAVACRPAPGDVGYQSMCRFIDSPERLMASIDSEKPLLGEPLNKVLSWDAATSSAGCHCELGDRLHKWRLVLETIHYALVEQERVAPAPSHRLMETS
jgi:hypothetical protein